MSTHLQFFQASPDIFVIADTEGRLLHVNRAWEAFFGVKEKEVVGQAATYVHPEDLPDMYSAIELLPKQGRVEYRGRAMRSDGRYVVLEWRATFADDRIYAVARVPAHSPEIGTTSDAANRLRVFFENTPVPVAMFDTEMRYQLASRNWQAYHRIGMDQLAGRSIYECHDLPDRWREVHAKALAGETIWSERDFLELPDGTKSWLRWTVGPWRTTDGEIGGIVIFAYDINEQIHNEERLAAAMREANAANRAKSVFLASMSHEIRTPMTAIMGYADLLADSGHSPDEQRQWTLQLSRNADHLLVVLNDILDLSKIEAGQMPIHWELVDLSSLLASVEEMMRPRADEKGIRFGVISDKTVDTMCSDSTRLRQILLNLVSNAIKYTEKGSVTIWVGTDSDSDSDGGPPELRIAVQDTGIGIPRDQQAAMFEPFTQVDDARIARAGSTGLGLAVSRQLATLLGGQILMKSAPGRGSEFTLRLPIERPDVVPVGGMLLAPVMATDADVAFDASLTVEDRIRLTEIRVLIADDSPDNRAITAHVLGEYEIQTEIAIDGRECIEQMDAARAAGRPFDLVLLDLQMPGMNGYQVANNLRGAGDDTPLIALTASVMNEDRARARDAGCSDFVGKPIRRSVLLQKVREWGTSRRQADR